MSRPCLLRSLVLIAVVLARVAPATEVGTTVVTWDDSGVRVTPPAQESSAGISLELAPRGLAIGGASDRAISIVLATSEPGTLSVRALSAGSLRIDAAGAHRVVFDGPVSVAGAVSIEGADVSVRARVRAGKQLECRGRRFAMASCGLVEVRTGSLRIRARNEIVLREGEIRAGAEIDLSARRVTVRDSPRRRFVAAAGEALKIAADEIDIFALGHRESVLASGGDLTLRSVRAAGGDAHFRCGGSFLVETDSGDPGDLHSPHDPVVLAAGDVAVGAYVGGSLHILAGGRVILKGATITGADAAENTVNPRNDTPINARRVTLADLSKVVLSDGTSLEVDGRARPTLDVRAGIDWRRLGGEPADGVVPRRSMDPDFERATSANIDVAGPITFDVPGGFVLLTNQWEPNGLRGGISAQDIDTSTELPEKDGGPVWIDSRQSVRAGDVSAHAQTLGELATGSGGEVKILAPAGSITVGEITAHATNINGPELPAGSAGMVTLSAADGISVGEGAGAVRANVLSGGRIGKGGDVTLITAHGDIDIGLVNTSAHNLFGSGDSEGPGRIVLRTQRGAVRAGSAPFGGLHAFSLTSGSAPGGGTILIEATDGIVISGRVETNGSGTDIDGGAITLLASGGDIFVAELFSSSLSSSSTPGDGGDILVEAAAGSVTTADVEAISTAFFIHNPSRDAGSVRLRALEGELATGHVRAYSEARGLEGTAGNGGDVELVAGAGSVTTSGEVSVFSRSALNNSNSNQAGLGGAIHISATEDVTLGGDLQSLSESPGPTGSARSGGEIVVAAQGGAIECTGSILSFASSRGDADNGGRVSLIAATGIRLSGEGASGKIDSTARSTDGSVGNGGDVELTTATGDVEVNVVDSSAWAPFGGGVSGDGGSISLRTAGGRVDVTASSPFGVAAALSSSSLSPADGGDSGDITVSATLGILVGGTLQSHALGIGSNGGDITLTSHGGDIVARSLITRALYNSVGSPGDGGNVTVEAPAGGISVGDVDASSNALLIHNPSGRGGAIALRGQGALQTGTLSAYSEARGADGPSTAGGTIEVTSTGESIAVSGDVLSYSLSAINNNRSSTAGTAGRVLLEAAEEIAVTGRVDASARSTGPDGTAGEAGTVELVAGGTIEFGSIDARSTGDTGKGPGAAVRITAGEHVRGTGTILLDESHTISTDSAPGTSEIRIRHGGSAPFAIGNATTSGVAGSITTGDAELVPDRSFPTTHFEPPSILIICGPGGLRLPGDCDQSGSLDLADGTCILGALFTATPPALPCERAGGELQLLDWQPDGVIDASDAVSLFLYLFDRAAPHPLALPGLERTACVPIAGCENADACP